MLFRSWVVESAFLLLDMAHLPHPTIGFVKGLAEKSVTAMKQAQAIADTVDKPKPNKTIVANFGQTNKPE